MTGRPLDYDDIAVRGRDDQGFRMPRPGLPVCGRAEGPVGVGHGVLEKSKAHVLEPATVKALR